MGTSFKAHIIYGVCIKSDRLYETLSIDGCKCKPACKGRFCSESGRPKKLELTKAIGDYPYDLDKAIEHAIARPHDEIKWGYDPEYEKFYVENLDTPFDVALQLNEEYSIIGVQHSTGYSSGFTVGPLHTFVENFNKIQAELKAGLEPKGLWDQDKCGLYVFLGVC